MAQKASSSISSKARLIHLYNFWSSVLDIFRLAKSSLNFSSANLICDFILTVLVSLNIFSLILGSRSSRSFPLYLRQFYVNLIDNQKLLEKFDTSSFWGDAPIDFFFCILRRFL